MRTAAVKKQNKSIVINTNPCIYFTSRSWYPIIKRGIYMQQVLKVGLRFREDLKWYHNRSLASLKYDLIRLKTLNLNTYYVKWKETSNKKTKHTMASLKNPRFRYLGYLIKIYFYRIYSLSLTWSDDCICYVIWVMISYFNLTLLQLYRVKVTSAVLLAALYTIAAVWVLFSPDTTVINSLLPNRLWNVSLRWLIFSV